MRYGLKGVQHKRLISFVVALLVALIAAVLLRSCPPEEKQTASALLVPEDVPERFDVRDARSAISYLKDHITLADYPGLARGAYGTLWAGSGNALDRSLLLGKVLEVLGHDVRILPGDVSGLWYEDDGWKAVVWDSGNASETVDKPAPGSMRLAESESTIGAAHHRIRFSFELETGEYHPTRYKPKVRVAAMPEALSLARCTYEPIVVQIKGNIKQSLPGEVPVSGSGGYELRIGNEVLLESGSLAGINRVLLRIDWEHQGEIQTFRRELYHVANSDPEIPGHAFPQPGDRYAIVVGSGPLVPEVFETREAMLKSHRHTSIDDPWERSLILLATRYMQEIDQATREMVAKAQVNVRGLQPRIVVTAVEFPPSNATTDNKAAAPAVSIDVINDWVGLEGPQAKVLQVARGLVLDEVETRVIFDVVKTPVISASTVLSHFKSGDADTIERRVGVIRSELARVLLEEAVGTRVVFEARAMADTTQDTAPSLTVERQQEAFVVLGLGIEDQKNGPMGVWKPGGAAAFALDPGFVALIVEAHLRRQIRTPWYVMTGRLDHGWAPQGLSVAHGSVLTYRVTGTDGGTRRQAVQVSMASGSPRGLWVNLEGDECQVGKLLGVWPQILQLDAGPVEVSDCLPAPVYILGDSTVYTRGEGVRLPQGGSSFPIEVVQEIPGNPAPAPDKPWSNLEAILSPPSSVRQVDKAFLSMGCRGVVRLRFAKGTMINAEGPDLFLFEAGSHGRDGHERVQVEVSVDEENWWQVGDTSQGLAVDFGDSVPEGLSLQYARLTDLGDDCGGEYPGADLDAVAAYGPDRGSVAAEGTYPRLNTIFAPTSILEGGQAYPYEIQIEGDSVTVAGIEIESGINASESADGRVVLLPAGELSLLLVFDDGKNSLTLESVSPVIHGLVTDMRTRHPIAQALINDLDGGGSIRTSVDGSFQLPLAKPLRPRMIIVIDLSGSMSFGLDSGSKANAEVGERRIDAVRRAAGRMLDSLPPNVEASLWVFNQPRDRYYGDFSEPSLIKVHQDFTTDREVIKRKLASLEPRGGTPLTAVLNRLEKVLTEDPLSQGATVIVLADGENSCTTVTAAAAYQKMTNRIPIHTIGFAVDPTGKADNQLDDLARISGGTYQLASSGRELETAFEKLQRDLDQVGMLVSSPNHAPKEISIAASTDPLSSIEVQLEPRGRDDHLILIVDDNINDLELAQGLSVKAQNMVRERVTGGEWAVLIPNRRTNIANISAYGWLEVHRDSGRLIGRTEDGLHSTVPADWQWPPYHPVDYMGARYVALAQWVKGTAAYAAGSAVAAMNWHKQPNFLSADSEDFEAYIQANALDYVLHSYADLRGLLMGIIGLDPLSKGVRNMKDIRDMPQGDAYFWSGVFLSRELQKIAFDAE